MSPGTVAEYMHITQPDTEMQSNVRPRQNFQFARELVTTGGKISRHTLLYFVLLNTGFPAIFTTLYQESYLELGEESIYCI